MVRDGCIATLVVATGRPGNALDADAWVTLGAMAEALRHDDDVAAVVLAAGGAAFCRGVVPDDRVAARRAEDAIEALARIEAPVVAAVSGAAEGLGLAIVLTADIVVADAKARFRAADPATGILPGGGVVQRLTRVVGPAKATTMLLLGTAVGLDEAIRTGLVQRRAPAGKVKATATKVAKGFARRAPIALRYAKEACRRAFDMTLDQGIRFEQDLYVLLQTTADRREGVAAFRERRAPRFVGR